MFRNGVTGGAWRAGLLLGLGAGLGGSVGGPELQAAAAVVAVVVGLASHASFFPNRAVGQSHPFKLVAQQ